MQQAFTELQRRYSLYLQTVHETLSKRGENYWTAAFEESRASVHAQAFHILRLLDPRFDYLQNTSLAPQLASILLERTGCELASLVGGVTFDEISFGAMWSAHSCPTFRLTASLAAELLLTDPGRVLQTDVPWPFPSFRIELPRPGLDLAFVTPNRPAPEPLVDFNVLSWTTMRDEWAAPTGPTSETHRVELDSLYTDSSLSRALHGILDQVLSWLPPPEARAPGMLVRGYCSRGFSLFNNQPWFGGESTVEDWLRSTERTQSTAFLPVDAPMEDLDLAAVKAMQRLAVNLSLYLVSENEHGQRPWSPTDKSERKAASTWTIGRDVKVSKEVREAAAAVAAGREAWSLAVRAIVRGHMKQQPFGPGRQSRKRIYIRPYWRGPEDAPSAPTRTYKL